jgi:glycosyltransferase involved in cell wall biosynthesis
MADAKEQNADAQDGTIEISVVMPCLNEADTLAACVDKAICAMRENGISGEVIVADNGSTDGSVEIAEKHGARVVRVSEKGYGNALMGGIAEAKGRFILMGDADDSYDFLELPKFVEKLRTGCDIAQGCRLETGGGHVEKGAMPFLHRYWGNPMFTMFVRNWFGADIHDVYCGLRGFTKDAYKRLALRCTGMEFATEMIIKAALMKMSIKEVPITLHPDGRKAHKPHLRTFRDGWRTLRFFLLYCPRKLYVLPGIFLWLLGAAFYAIIYGKSELYGIHLGAHTLLVASLCIIMGYQSMLFGALTKVFAIGEGLLPMDRKAQMVFKHATMERGLVIGGLSTITGIALIGVAGMSWVRESFGPLDYSSSMKFVVPGVTLAALGFQTVLASFFVSLLGLRRKNPNSQEIVK